ncbi:unnamed protein product, partial [Adineta ricciae]
MALMPIVKVVDLYRHELFDNGFGIEWMDDSDDEPRKIITEETTNEHDSQNNDNHVNGRHSRSIITVRSIDNKATCLPAHIWRSLAKIVPGDVVVELNGVSTAGQTVAEFEKNLKLSGNRIRIRLKSDNSGYSSTTLTGTTWHSPSSHNNEHSTDNKILTNGHSHIRSTINNHSMTNGYNSSTKSRSCENNLDTCGRKVSDELASSSSSLIDLPTPIANGNTDYDNLATVNGHEEVNGESTIIRPPITRISVQPQSPISGGLDQKTKDEIDARLKDIDDEFEFNIPVTAETVNKSVDLPSARRLAKRLYSLDGFKSTDVMRHLCK